MSSGNNLDVTVAATLEHISAQLDGTTEIVKIPTSGFDLLSTEGQIALKSYAGSIVGHPVEFYLDGTDLKRVYLANIATIKACRPCETKVIPGFSLPVLFPSLPPGQLPPPALNPQHPTPPLEAQPSALAPAPAPQNKKRKVTNGPDGFTAFRSHHWPFMKQRNPGATRTEIGTIMSAKWAAMTEEERKPYSQSSGYHSIRRPPSDSSEEGPVQTTPDILEQSQTMKDHRPPSSGNRSGENPPEPHLAHSDLGDFGQGQNASEWTREDKLTDNLSLDAIAFLRGEIDWKTCARNLGIDEHAGCVCHDH
ncbi:hypothetical protein F4803DRAFT_547377 [Xylaria telfairii]|nr:hypothetical protein F4803DRAFT_547377 [Xylaria telfairii]